MRKLILAIGLSLLLSASAAQADNIADCNQGKDLDKRIRGCSKIVKLNIPKNIKAIAYEQRGSAYLGKAEVDKALSDYEAAIRLAPKSAKGHLGRGLAYKMKKEYRRAIADFTTAINLGEKVSGTYAVRAEAYWALPDAENEKLAFADYDEAVRLAPSAPSPYVARGYAHLQIGSHDQAIADFSQAIKLDPKLAHAYAVRAVSYASKGDLARYKEDLEAAKRLGLDLSDVQTDEDCVDLLGC